MNSTEKFCDVDYKNTFLAQEEWENDILYKITGISYDWPFA